MPPATPDRLDLCEAVRPLLSSDDGAIGALDSMGGAGLLLLGAGALLGCLLTLCFQHVAKVSSSNSSDAASDGAEAAFVAGRKAFDVGTGGGYGGGYGGGNGGGNGGGGAGGAASSHGAVGFGIESHTPIIKVGPPAVGSAAPPPPPQLQCACATPAMAAGAPATRLTAVTPAGGLDPSALSAAAAAGAGPDSAVVPQTPLDTPGWLPAPLEKHLPDGQRSLQGPTADGSGWQTLTFLPSVEALRYERSAATSTGKLGRQPKTKMQVLGVSLQRWEAITGCSTMGTWQSAVRRLLEEATQSQRATDLG